MTTRARINCLLSTGSLYFLCFYFVTMLSCASSLQRSELVNQEEHRTSNSTDAITRIISHLTRFHLQCNGVLSYIRTTWANDCTKKDFGQTTKYECNSISPQIKTLSLFQVGHGEAQCHFRLWPSEEYCFPVDRLASLFGTNYVPVAIFVHHRSRPTRVTYRKYENLIGEIFVEINEDMSCVREIEVRVSDEKH